MHALSFFYTNYLVPRWSFAFIAHVETLPDSWFQAEDEFLLSYAWPAFQSVIFFVGILGSVFKLRRLNLLVLLRHLLLLLQLLILSCCTTVHCDWAKRDAWVRSLHIEFTAKNHPSLKLGFTTLICVFSIQRSSLGSSLQELEVCVSIIQVCEISLNCIYNRVAARQPFGEWCH